MCVRTIDCVGMCVRRMRVCSTARTVCVLSILVVGMLVVFLVVGVGVYGLFICVWYTVYIYMVGGGGVTPPGVLVYVLMGE